MPSTDDRMMRWLRSLARWLGLVAGSFWLLALLLAWGTEGLSGLSLEGAVLGALVIAAVGGVLVSFRDELFGAIMALAGGVGLTLFAAFAAGQRHWLAAVTSGGPFLVIGALLMASWYRGHHLRRHRTRLPNRAGHD